MHLKEDHSITDEDIKTHNQIKLKFSKRKIRMLFKKSRNHFFFFKMFPFELPLLLHLLQWEVRVLFGKWLPTHFG